MDAMARADIVGAGGDQPAVYAVMTEIAFLSDLFGGIEGDGIVRTDLNTEPASDAGVCIQDDDAVRQDVDVRLVPTVSGILLFRNHPACWAATVLGSMPSNSCAR